MAWLGYVLMAAGAAKNAQAQRKLGKQKNILANYKADQLDTMAGQERSKSQRVAAEKKRQMRLAMSRALAVAGASGAGAADVGMLNIYAGLEAEGEYASELALYEGEERARNLEVDAKNQRISGGFAEDYGNEAAQATMLSAAGNMYSGMSTKSAPNSTLTQKYSPVAGDAYQPAQSYYGNYPR